MTSGANRVSAACIGTDRHSSVYFNRMKNLQCSKLFVFVALIAAAAQLFAQSQAATKPEDTELWEPEPAVVTPGASCMAPLSDAIVLFDGKNEDEKL